MVIEVSEEALRKALTISPVIYQKHVKGRAEIGELVELEYEGRTICAMWDETGPVRLRVLLNHECPSTPEEALEEALERAYRVRRLNGAANWDAFRLVNGDGDMLSGLIIDIYKEIAVLQSSSLAIDKYIKFIAERVRNLLKLESVYEKSVQRVRRKVGLPEREGLILGTKKETVVDEEGVKFLVRVDKQKTGLYLDQRENRVFFERFAKGEKVLDAFSYTGGFGLHALHGGAKKVKFVDEDHEALSILKENLRLNSFSEEMVEIVESDIWRYLKEERSRFGLLSFDPPAFIPSKEYYDLGVRDYLKVYINAFKLAEEGSVVVLSSCSQPLSRDDFLRLISKASFYAKVDARTFALRGASRDHVMLPNARHLEYLKVAFLSRL
ncbi:SAM-dependent methyltransferase [Ignicoccus pacificus DSM 13166]|uniref:SAM-dependent methyltransferase n=1 Tax=Ignicoccus pacificus DSM 13166 TaxID=940294 RepID=A0A977PKG4_9CREN|nr:SAM-dependent methyltransferase [Ignicoccus pacificus DSM 13166]